MRKMTSSRYYQGLGFNLWTSRGAWFWQLVNRCRGAGAIGAAPTETEALGEVYAAIEEVSARCPLAAPALTLSGNESREPESPPQKVECCTGGC
jgi:hypothetical protein